MATSKTKAEPKADPETDLAPALAEPGGPMPAAGDPAKLGDATPIPGHYVYVDLDNKDVKKALKDAGAENATGNYAVMHSLDSAGVAQVQFRDETHARVFVPVKALRAAPSGRR